jgi:hypothetical protein
MCQVGAEDCEGQAIRIMGSQWIEVLKSGGHVLGVQYQAGDGERVGGERQAVGLQSSGENPMEGLGILFLCFAKGGHGVLGADEVDFWHGLRGL